MLQPFAVLRKPLIDRVGLLGYFFYPSLAVLTLPKTLLLLSEWTGLKKLESSYCHGWQVESDRPPLVTFVQVASETIQIAARVLGSLATGTVVQRMFTDKSEGKIKVVVSLILLGLSFVNTCKTVALSAEQKIPERK
jgi:hypothetical protein